MASTALAVNTTSTPFRIMAAGASVTFGVGSTTGDSYRKDFQDLMTANGMSVDYVGTKKHGNFSNNAVEATSGFVISQIAAALHTAVPKFLPNLVLIDAGTNNCNKGGLVPDAGTNITNMINDVFALSPGSTVILATVLVNSVEKQDACRVDENKQFTALAAKMQAEGAKLVLVDMRGPDGPLVTDLADGRHPNDVGYSKMAKVWFSGVQEVVSKGLLSPASSKTINPAATQTPPAAGAADSTRTTVPLQPVPSSASSHLQLRRVMQVGGNMWLGIFLSWLSINVAFH
ncbi:SGNH hydrolase [Polyplosphaeria fusca]|uniref:SGNH hydrolase n=1 Tax=Polyplosphaeria fusca TaxID=682080 RepID=A0A9P4UVX9_9PLEO|nr:SGNH hydrolase [Polyplosphaeria fusca]